MVEKAIPNPSKVIPIRIDEGTGLTPSIGTELRTPHGQTKDTRGRPLRDLRISVTDRCNFRCTYCMTDQMEFIPRSQILSLEECLLIAKVFIESGISKIRLTGGEPLVRRNMLWLVERIRNLDGLRELTLTTNGSALKALARPLRDAGLKRITVSLDSLDDEVFRAMNGIDFPVQRVLDGIAAAFTALGDPETHAKILIDPASQHGEPAEPLQSPNGLRLPPLG